MENAPFTILIDCPLFLMIDPDPTHSLDVVPPTHILFITSHNDMLNMDSFPFEKLLLDLFHSDSIYR